jgi:hypothetical protein
MTKQCIVCGIGFETPQSKAKYCSRKCSISGRKPIRLYDRTCSHCGKEFHPKIGGNKGLYCSRECAFAAKAVRSQEKKAHEARAKEQALIKVCRVCGITYTANNIASKICSDECKKDEARQYYEDTKEVQLQRMRDNYIPVPHATKVCEVCGKLFSGHSRNKMCSIKCAKKNIRGHDHKERALYFGVEYEPVNALKVFARDSWTCQICGRKAPERLRGKHMPTSPELDHRVPMSKGGGHTYSNTQCSCRRCNGAKGNTSNAGQIPLFN